ncbi:MAG TPA: amidohydrolase [Chlamydiales bacterium]|nr:amidohydrolase [Chlamydiales bacterium]
MKYCLLAILFAFSGWCGQTVDLLILGGTVVTMNEARSVIDDGGVAIHEGMIVAVGSKAEIKKKYSSKRVIDGEGKAIIPGLINGHGHLPMTLFRGLADDLDLNDWLMNYILPAEARNVNEAFVRAGTRLGLAEMFRGGTTTIADMYFFEDAVAEEAARAGMRGIFGQGVLDFPTPDSATFDEGMEKAERMVKKWKDHFLIRPGIAPHSPYTLSEEHLKRVSEFSKRTGTPILIHISETEREIQTIQQQKGISPIAYLNQIGFFDTQVIAAHIVFPKVGDLSILKEKGVSVIHNPQSNMKLSSGIAPIPEILLANIAVGIGTDGAASNNTLSLWEEMDTAAKLHKVASKDPKVINAEEAFTMATIGGARALGMEKEIGSIEVGKKGDIALVDLDGFHQTPCYNIYSTLIYATSASDVQTVIVNGDVVMENRTLLTLDERAIKKDARHFRGLVKESLRK